MQYIDCKQYAQEILDEVKASATPKTLRILSMGNNPASDSYIKGKKKDCDYCGINYEHIHTNSEDRLIHWIEKGNLDSNVGGTIVQLPLPDGVDKDNVLRSIWSKKDVDGFGHGSPFKPCTPEAIMYVIQRELGLDLAGKTALVIGKGKLVGKPVAQMLLDEGVTVTIAHSRTQHLEQLLQTGYYDIIIVAVGKPGIVNLMHCTADIVIDVGVNKTDDGKLCGDCYGFNHDILPNMKVTPVPNGIGLLTRAMLMRHMTQV